ncbi:MAG: glycosyltransferase family 2 protein [Desulfovibrio sp.]|nr:glycosyltransferase family 2 protein [Desulfovibrio sp.]
MDATINRKLTKTGDIAQIAVVVVTYNRCQLLLENIEALREQDFCERYDVLIIDNASTDGTQDEVKALLEKETEASGLMRLKYQNTGANLGGAGGFQYGVRWAVEHGYEYIWLMDDDCLPRPDALTALTTAGKKAGNFGWLSSKALWKDGSLCAMNVQKQSLLKKVEDFESELSPAIMATFVSLFLSADMVREVGLPIKEFFIWSDDFEYTRRISRLYPCYVCNHSVVLHKTASNVGSNIAMDSLQRLPRYGYMYRNEFYLYRREGVKGLAYQAARVVYHILRILRDAPSHRGARLACLLKSVCKGFAFHPNIEFPCSSVEQKS